MWVHIVNCAGRLVFYFFGFSKHSAHLMLMKPICGRGFLTQWVHIDFCHYPSAPAAAQLHKSSQQACSLSVDDLGWDSQYMCNKSIFVAHIILKIVFQNKMIYKIKNCSQIG